MSTKKRRWGSKTPALTEVDRDCLEFLCQHRGVALAGDLGVRFSRLSASPSGVTSRARSMRIQRLAEIGWVTSERIGYRSTSLVRITANGARRVNWPLALIKAPAPQLLKHELTCVAAHNFVEGLGWSYVSEWSLLRQGWPRGLHRPDGIGYRVGHGPVIFEIELQRKSKERLARLIEDNISDPANSLVYWVGPGVRANLESVIATQLPEGMHRRIAIHDLGPLAR